MVVVEIIIKNNYLKKINCLRVRQWILGKKEKGRKKKKKKERKEIYWDVWLGELVEGKLV